MSNLLYLIALILIVSWAISLFVYRAGSMVHVLIVLAVAILVLRFFYSIRTKS
jgi:hypothetical protein